VGIPNSSKRRIAIVGTGISGMAAGRALHERHDITVFEANDYIGGHTNTVMVDDPAGRYGIDTGFIVYNERNYPLFSGLLKRLGVATEPTEMSFGVHCEQTGLEYNGSSFSGLFAQRANLFKPAFYAMLADILRFNRTAERILGEDHHETLGDYLAARNLGARFRDQYLVPMAAAIWSASPLDILDFPAKAMIRFFANHGLLSLRDRPQWRVVSGGSANYVAKLVEPYRNRIRLNSPITSISREHGKVRVEIGRDEKQQFDSVFLACHSDQALKLLADPSAKEQEILGAIGYQRNEAVLHTDTSILPRRARALAAWNYRIPAAAAADPVLVTYSMNTLQNIQPQRHYCVSLNSGDRIREADVIKRISYDHPVFNPEALVAQRRLSEINGVHGTYYCGAYWGWGFHEDGVHSATNAVQVFEKHEHEPQRNLRRAG